MKTTFTPTASTPTLKVALNILLAIKMIVTLANTFYYAFSVPTLQCNRLILNNIVMTQAVVFKDKYNLNCDQTNKNCSMKIPRLPFSKWLTSYMDTDQNS